MVTVRIGIIGAGFMGGAFARGLLHAGVAPADIVVHSRRATRRNEFSERGIQVTDDLAIICANADIVVLAMKPHELPAFARDLRGRLSAETVLISIAAGVPLNEVQRESEHSACVRVMPNLPAAIGEGAAVFFPAFGLTDGQQEDVRFVLESVATAVIEVSDDATVDVATAISGSGPAYVYLVAEALIDAAVRQGMKRADASALTLATVAGAARYATGTGRLPAELREAATPPGGMTAAGVAELERSGVRAAFNEAVTAAATRTQEQR